MAEGSTVELDRVLLVGADDKVTTGTPTVDGARVMATAVGAKKGKKVLVFNYKNKTRQNTKTGHRQLYTTLKIDRVVAPGVAEEAQGEAKKPRTRRKKEVTESGS